jgi:hypothetical protein
VRPPTIPPSRPGDVVCGVTGGGAVVVVVGERSPVTVPITVDPPLPEAGCAVGVTVAVAVVPLPVGAGGDVTVGAGAVGTTGLLGAATTGLRGLVPLVPPVLGVP